MLGGRKDFAGDVERVEVVVDEGFDVPESAGVVGIAVEIVGVPPGVVDDRRVGDVEQPGDVAVAVAVVQQACGESGLRVDSDDVVFGFQEFGRYAELAECVEREITALFHRAIKF